MAILFSGLVYTDYNQIYVESRQNPTVGPTEPRLGQVNGLVGAALPGHLELIIGLHYGQVSMTIEALDGPPPFGDEWGDVVEVSLRPVSGRVVLQEWGGGAQYPLKLKQVSYRTRYCAIGLDEAKTRTDPDESTVERYLLQFWPAPPAPDAVLRQTSQQAEYRNGAARSLPSPQEYYDAWLAEKARREAEHRRRAEDAAAQASMRRWNGPPPSAEAQQAVNAGMLVRVDRALVDAIDTADPATQRAVAIWCAQRAFSEAGLSDVDWIRPALAALAAGEPLPPPFGERSNPFDRLRADPRVPRTTVASYDGRHPRISQQHTAVPSLRDAAGPVPVVAALQALCHAMVTFGEEYPRLFRDLRATFDLGGV